MTEPDELYTLRAQFWLGHYGLAAEEAKAVARRPMSATLKAEREDYLHRALLGLGQASKVLAAPATTPGLKAVALQARYVTASTPEEKDKVAEEMKALLAMEGSGNTSVQLTAANVYLQHGMTKEALQCVHLGSTMEHIGLSLLIYLKLDRLDLAQEQLGILRQNDEDSVLTQLGSVYIALATGASGAQDALHSLNSLSEQYGPSPLLANLMACGHMAAGEYDQAEKRLLECLKEFPDQDHSDTLVNLVTCSHYLNKPTQNYVAQMKAQYPAHNFCSGLDRVEGAFDRESIKYKVPA